MRILLWYWGRRGGGAQYTLGLAQALAGRPGVELSLSVSAQGEFRDRFRNLSVPTDIVDTYRDLSGFATGLLRLPALTRQLIGRARQADVVVSGMTHVWAPLVAPALARSGAAFVQVVHDATPHPGDFGLAWNWRLGRELGAARAAVALSDQVAVALAARAPALPLIRMPLPALLPAAPAAPPAAAGPGALRLLFFGRLRAYKGLDLLRDAFRLLHQSHPGASLRVVGEGDPEACAPGLAGLPGVRLERRWVAEAEIPTLLAEADAVVLPYREASQSGVAPQALAMGVPVVATPVGGLTEQVRPGAGGVLAAAVTAPALAEALAGLMDPARLAALRQEAARAGAAASDWDAAATALLAGLARVLR
ncbi:glycosyltransferase family 4 protein [Falsiroseomonas sp.]|uniref:glycosyltransferase family 4 protein n=1 Tax=Falsiroseomonas sp. TaxID=2870721 RepID=UPI0027357374|nr:glycosyltransferase family 4 protein [Falsiroseomonas sp.]MDP3418703.1 glycosyltransferase family 4 protein [Falsiroseomonas sp.]